MKSNPFVIACAFMLGSLVALAFAHTWNQGIEAQQAGVGGVKNVSALTLTTDSDKEVLIVFKEVKNLLAEGSEDENITGMAVYEFDSKGNRKGNMVLLSTRYIDYDLAQYEYNNEKGDMLSVLDMKENLEKALKEIESRQEKKNKKR